MGAAATRAVSRAFALLERHQVYGEDPRRQERHILWPRTHPPYGMIDHCKEEHAVSKQYVPASPTLLI
jgi:hypothetical protein